MSHLIRIILLIIVTPIIWGLKLFKKNRLEKLDLIDLGAKVEIAFELYGEPDESTDEGAGVIVHKFILYPFFTIILHEVEGVVKLVTCWSEHPSPNRDLVAVADKYGEEVGWDELEEGFLYWRKDEKVKLWCSAIPAIGVSYKDYIPPEQD